MTLTAAEWLLLGVGLGGLAAAVTALMWRTFGRPPRARRRRRGGGSESEGGETD